MTLEQQIKAVIEAATAQLSGHLHERLQALAGDVGQAASVEHVRGVEEAVAAARAEAGTQLDAALAAARTEAAEQREVAVSMARAEAGTELDAALTAARTEAAEQRELAVSMARAEAAEAHESALAAARTQAADELELALAAEQTRAAEHLESALAAARAEAADQRESALLAIRAEVAEAHEGALAAARTEAGERLALAGADTEQRLASARALADEELARTVEAARQEAAQATELALVDARAAERHAELALAERLVDAVRRLDVARSLTDTLDVLVDAAGREVSRVAVFLVRGTTLTGWRAAGFTRDDDPCGLDIALDQAGLLSRAVRATSAIATSDALSGESNLTPFGTLPPASAAVAVPLRVGGETVAVLYSDDVTPRGHEVPSAWPEAVEVLARHAARCLEGLTVAQVTRPLAIPASAPTPRRTPQPWGHQAGHDDDDDAARRYARLLVSEIKLYNEAAVTQGRRDRNVLDRLRPEIDRARRLYDERVPAAILASTDHFNQELVRTLANGDATLLGPA